MTGANYDLIARGGIDKYLTDNPEKTFWRSVWRKHTRFACESVSQPFSTVAAFGSEGQLTLNRVGDLVYFVYLHVTLPGLVTCDSAAAACNGLGPSRFPSAANPCAPCAANDEAALVEFLPSDYASLSPSEQQDRLKEAKDAWRREQYGAGRELGCCAEGDDCPDQLCEDLGENYAHWCNSVGQALIESSKLIVGGQQVDRLWGTFLLAWEELTGKSGRRLTELTGRRYTRGALVCASREEQELFIPLPYYFTLSSGSALPLAALTYHGVQINVEFARLERLVCVSGGDVGVRNARTGMALSPNDLKAELEITYVYLDTEERAAFTKNDFKQLVVQTQAYTKTESTRRCRIPLSFNHPCLEILFMVRRACHEASNNFTNFSGIDGRDAITHAELLLNTTSRFGKKSALYWRAVVPYERHSNIPEAFIYVMSFALTPEDASSPSGSVNLSRIDSIELVLDMQPGMEKEAFSIYVYARSWNIMNFSGGTAGLAFQ
jgi:hypothetical protein